METEVVIRAATRRDMPSILALWEELMDFHAARDPFWRPAQDGRTVFARFLEQNLGNDAACVLVAIVDGRVVGYCQAVVDRHPPVLAEPDYGHVLDFAVTAPYRGRGIGGRMVAALREWFAREGIRRIEVRHATGNELAAQFWARMGFHAYLQTLFADL